MKACDESDLSVPGRVMMKKFKRTGDEIRNKKVHHEL